MTGRGNVDAVVLGAGGFIGGHLVDALLDEGAVVRAVDIKPAHEWHQVHADAQNFSADASDFTTLNTIMNGADDAEVYNLACNMGGMGFIESNKLECTLSVLTSVNAMRVAAGSHAGRYFHASSACVYAGYRQTDADVEPLREDYAYPADAEDGYGWEKLFAERTARHFREDAGLETRIARYHNIYGPHGTWEGGREKAPAAACRKVALAVLLGHRAIEVWGDGEQTRSFTYVDDCVYGTTLIARGDYVDPLNLGSSELVTINQLYHLVASIAGIEVELKHVPGPLGVRGRNSDNELIKSVYDWEPSTSLEEGLEKTYAWVYDQVKKKIG